MAVRVDDRPVRAVLLAEPVLLYRNEDCGTQSERVGTRGGRGIREKVSVTDDSGKGASSNALKALDLVAQSRKCHWDRLSRCKKLPLEEERVCS